MVSRLLRLTLRGIPPTACDYRLGNRSAVEWVPKTRPVPRPTEPRSGIINAPNREDDERYILLVMGQAITVSLETQKVIATLRALNLGV